MKSLLFLVFTLLLVASCDEGNSPAPPNDESTALVDKSDDPQVVEDSVEPEILPPPPERWWNSPCEVFADYTSYKWQWDEDPDYFMEVTCEPYPWDPENQCWIKAGSTTYLADAYNPPPDADDGSYLELQDNGTRLVEYDATLDKFYVFAKVE